MSRVAAALIVSSAACVACSFLVDTSGLGGPDLPAGDASADASRPASDAASDASSPADAEAAAPAGCTAFFCDDFERPAGDVLGAWSAVLTNAGGALAIAAGQGSNGSSALRVRLPSSGTESMRANLSKSMMTSKDVRLSFAMRLDAATTREVHLAEVFGDGESRGVFLLFAPGGQLKVAFQTYGSGGTYTDRTVAGFAPGTWQRYEIDVTTGVVPHAVVRLDDGEVASDDVPFPIEAVTQVDLGSSFTRAGDAVDVFFDDVRVDVAK